MKNTLIKWLGGVTKADHEAHMRGLETRLHIRRQRVKSRDRTIKRLTDSLSLIAACETPSANATVRRMAREAASSVPFTIDSDGLVGLGTDTPSKPLDVKGSDRG